jgi:DNA-binding PadR family transcriptional regulator
VPKRFFRHGELPLVVLALLAERAMHGYEVMAELSRLFGPRYRPSPGSVYPAVEALEAEGLIDGQKADGKTTYRLTREGADALESRAELLAQVELRTGVRLRQSDALESTLAHFNARVTRLEGRVAPELVEAVLERAAMEIESLDGLVAEGAR